MFILNSYSIQFSISMPLNPLFLFIIEAILLNFTLQHCLHDQLSSATQNAYLDDEQQYVQRNLATVEKEGIRIFYDFGYLDGIDQVQKVNSIKRMMNISQSYFKKSLKVIPASSLIYPQTGSALCGLLQVPTKYYLQNISADLGIFVGGQQNYNQQYIAKSINCVLSKTNNRPLWGMIMWNSVTIQIDQFGFQQTLYVALHQLTHILGFSAQLFDKYPNGSPLKNVSGGYVLDSPKIRSQLLSYFACPNPEGIPLEDQDSVLISSHWQQKFVKNEYMTTQNKKGAYVSRFSLALLDSIGWYDVDYLYAQPSLWGKNAGCEFFNIDNCQGNQFCTQFAVLPDWDHTAYGICTFSLYSGVCKSINYYSNTICLNPYIYETSNPNRATYRETFQIAGHDSRAYESSFHNISSRQPTLPMRCYRTICGFSGKFLMIGLSVYNGTYESTLDQKLISQGQKIVDYKYIIPCRYPGQIKQSPLQNIVKGTLKCPANFDRICKTSRTCPYHCNKNGLCIDGQCLCNGNDFLNITCLDSADVSISVATNSKKWKQKDYIKLITKSIKNQKELGKKQGVKKQDKIEFVIASRQSIDTPCISGSFLDPNFGICLNCQQKFGCSYCSVLGCLVCDDGSPPIKSSCLHLDQL